MTRDGPAQTPCRDAARFQSTQVIPAVATTVNNNATYLSFAYYNAVGLMRLTT
jgi:hypothetical protein